MPGGEFSAGSVVAKFVADMSGFKAGMVEAKKQTSTMKSDFANLGSTVGKLAGVFGLAFGTAGVVKFLGDSVKAFGEAQRQMAQTEAVIRSTGGAAGLTAGDIAKMAKEIQNTTAISDEAAQQGMNMLLTFTNIGHDIFPQATQAIMDMSTAMNGGLVPSGEQLSNTAIQVGKALQDPILGVTALRRVGVNFNETQTEMIKKMVESGKTMDAQKYILKELGSEFGGSAAAQVGTFGGRMEQLKNKFDDFQEIVGEIVTPAIEFLADAFSGVLGPATQYLSAHMTELKVFVVAAAGAFLMLGQVAIGVAQTIGYALMLNFGKARDSFYTMIGSISQTFVSTQQKMTDVSRVQTDKQTNIVKSGLNQQSQASSKKSKEVQKDLEDETRKFKEEMDKRKAKFQESLDDLIRAHLEKKAELEKEIKDENADFAETMEERKESFQEKMDDMKASHQEKVDAIMAQIDQEKAKGDEADLAKITSLQLELQKENDEYALQKKRTEDAEAEETAKLQKEHDQRLLDYQTRLNTENEVLKLHQSDVDAIKNKAKEDDITRLKRQFAEENESSTKEHERRMLEIAERGSSLGDTLGNTMASGLNAHAGEIKGIGEGIASGFSEKMTSGISEGAKEAGERMVTEFINGTKNKAMEFGTKVERAGGKLNEMGLLGPIFQIIELFKNIRGYATGGLVPGTLGQAQLAVVHGGEKITPPGVAESSRMASGIILNIDLGGALISDEAGARRMGELVGDNIIKKLQQNVRF